ncbi:MAG: hypothetical protein ABEJ92_08550 [Halobacteriales archaeon]
MGDAPDDRSAEDGPADDALDEEPLRRRVEERYDFEDFRAADMAEMSLEEWEAAFDPDTWITGDALLDRVEAELRARVADGQLFAVVERHTVDGEDGLLAYTDAEYAVVRPDGTVEGDAGLRRDVEPVVALCSMADYEVADPPADAGLPEPARVQPGAGGLGHRLLLAVAGVQLVAGLVLLFAPLVVRLGPGAGALTTVVGLGFIGIGVVLGLLVANARLSDRFRAEEYRERLRAAGVGRDERPSFLPPLGDDADARGPGERDAE